jgi:hypothetical protein
MCIFGDPSGVQIVSVLAFCRALVVDTTMTPDQEKLPRSTPRLLGAFLFLSPWLLAAMFGELGRGAQLQIAMSLGAIAAILSFRSGRCALRELFCDDLLGSIAKLFQKSSKV